MRKNKKITAELHVIASIIGISANFSNYDFQIQSSSSLDKRPSSRPNSLSKSLHRKTSPKTNKKSSFKTKPNPRASSRASSAGSPRSGDTKSFTADSRGRPRVLSRVSPRQTSLKRQISRARARAYEWPNLVKVASEPGHAYTCARNARRNWPRVLSAEARLPNARQALVWGCADFTGWGWWWWPTRRGTMGRWGLSRCCWAACDGSLSLSLFVWLVGFRLQRLEDARCWHGVSWKTRVCRLFM